MSLESSLPAGTPGAQDIALLMQFICYKLAKFFEVLQKWPFELDVPKVSALHFPSHSRCTVKGMCKEYRMREASS